jgi:hypothetical protein
MSTLQLHASLRRRTTFLSPPFEVQEQILGYHHSANTKLIIVSPYGLQQRQRSIASLPRRSRLTRRQVGPGITLQTPLWNVLDSSPEVCKAVMPILARWTAIEIYGFISARKISRHVPLEFVRSAHRIHYHESHGRARTRWKRGDEPLHDVEYGLASQMKGPRPFEIDLSWGLRSPGPLVLDVPRGISVRVDSAALRCIQADVVWDALHCDDRRGIKWLDRVLESDSWEKEVMVRASFVVAGPLGWGVSIRDVSVCTGDER